MKFHFFTVPYDSGEKNVRMGKGPEHLVNAVTPLFPDPIQVSSIETKEDFPLEIKTSFHLYDKLSQQVQSLPADQMPVVFSGNCNASIGTIAALGSDICIIWFDGHTDFNTPETTKSGFLDGMGLSTIAGLCWEKMAASVNKFEAVNGNKILIIGCRDYSNDEKANIEKVGATMISYELIRNENTKNIEPYLQELSRLCKKAYLHIDLDVIDPAIAVANEFAPSNGLSPEEIVEAIHCIKKHFKVAAVGFASYDPEHDKTDSFPGIVKDIILEVSS